MLHAAATPAEGSATIREWDSRLCTRTVQGSRALAPSPFETRRSISVESGSVVLSSIWPLQTYAWDVAQMRPAADACCGLGPVPVKIWVGRAQSSCSTAVGGSRASPEHTDVEGARPVLAQMRAGTRVDKERRTCGTVTAAPLIPRRCGRWNWLRPRLTWVCKLLVSGEHTLHRKIRADLVPLSAMRQIAYTICMQHVSVR